MDILTDALTWGVPRAVALGSDLLPLIAIVASLGLAVAAIKYVKG